MDDSAPRSPESALSLPGRYTPENIYFPYETLRENLQAHDPDLLVCAGDQLYEWSPTRAVDPTDPTLDYLYKWYLWLWAFRSLTRETPTIVLTDDHDVYQPNLWGSGGGEASVGNLHTGGYVGSPEFVNQVQRIQSAHNPDPADSTSTARGLDTYYGAFTYGGTQFAMLEDRKFKTGPSEPDTVERTLLGERQEQFLADWANQVADTAPTVCLTQTAFASTVTNPNHNPVTPAENPLVTYDTNVIIVPETETETGDQVTIEITTVRENVAFGAIIE